MPGDKIGRNLFMCIPPDHMRDDLPGCTADYIRPVVEQAAAWPTPTYVMFDNGEQRMKIPIQRAGFDGHELHIYAEVKP